MVYANKLSSEKLGIKVTSSELNRYYETREKKIT